MTEKKKVILIDTDPAKKSLSELRKDVTLLREAISTMDKGTDEYNETLTQLNSTQLQISSIMNATKLTATALEGSYNALTFQMSQLREQWKATNDEAERDALGLQINSINDKLKELDASTGNYLRNVGNYADSFTEAFGAMGGGCNLLSSGVTKVKKGLDILKSHPIIAIIAVVVTILIKIVEAMKRNEEAVNKFNKALAPLKAIVDVIMKAFDALVSMIADAFAWLMDLIDPLLKLLGIESEVLKTELKIAYMQANNTQLQRDMLVLNALLELEIAELKAKAALKDVYNAATRLKLIEEAGEKQKKIAANNLLQAKDELALLELQASTGVNDAEMNDKLAQARANVLKVQKDYNTALRETNTLIVEVKNSIASENKAASDAAKRRREELARLRKEYKSLMDTMNSYYKTDFLNEESAIEKERLETIQKLKEEYKKRAISKKEFDKGVAAAELLAFSKTLDLYEKLATAAQEFSDNLKKEYASDTAAKIIAEKEKWNGIYKTMVDARKNHLITLEQFDQLEADLAERSTKAIAKVRLEAEKEEGLKELQILRDNYILKVNGILDYVNQEKLLLLQKVKEGTMSEKLYLDAMTELEINANITRLELATSYMELLNAIQDESITSTSEYADVVSSTMSEITSSMEELIQNERDLIAKHTDIIIASLDITQQTLNELADMGDGFSSKWVDSIGRVSQLVNLIGENLKTGEKGWKSYTNIAAASLNVVGSMLGALADELDETTREGFEAQKKLLIGQAMMSMFSGIMAAWTSSMALPAPASFILGAIQTAATATLGGILIANIAKLTFDSSSSAGASASPSASGAASVVAPVQYTQDVLGASIEESIQNTKVYVTESDIKETSSKVDVTESEARY